MITLTLSLVTTAAAALTTLLLPLADFLTRHLTGTRSGAVSRRESPATGRPARSAA
jgi:hypothetical protein